MKRTWNVDDQTLVEARVAVFRKTHLFVNDVAVPGKLSARKRNKLDFTLPDGRQASMSVRPRFGTRPEFALTVDDRLMVETGKRPIKCDGCNSIVKPNDRFCASCGHEMPSAETYVHRDDLKKATRAIVWLAALFVVSGVAMFYVSNEQSEKALTNLSGLDAASIYPKLIGGHRYTVAELRQQIAWEPRSMLIVNLILAAVMGGLALWGRRSPLPAILIATATYVVVTVTSGLLNPATLGQGLIVKIIVIALLVRGIKAALALRPANA